MSLGLQCARGCALKEGSSAKGLTTLGPTAQNTIISDLAHWKQGRLVPGTKEAGELPVHMVGSGLLAPEM